MSRMLLILSSIATSFAIAQPDQASSRMDQWNAGYQESVQSVTQATLPHRWSNGALLFQRETQEGKSELRCALSSGKISPASAEEIALRKSPQEDAKKKDKPAAQSGQKGSSPDGKWIASVKEGKVTLKRRGEDTARELAAPTSSQHYYQDNIVWNATSTHFYALYVEPGQRRHFTMVESSPKGQLQPKVHRVRYDKPGDKIDRVEPHVFSIDGHHHKPDRKLTPNPFSIAHLEWDNPRNTLLYEYIERGFDKHSLIAMDAETGEERPLVQDQSDTFIYVFGTRYRKLLPDTGEIIWASDRDGWRHLYLLDAATGSVKKRITKGDWLVRSIEKVDLEKRQITFIAMGKNPKEDPYHKHWYRVNFDGSKLVALTRGDGTHKLEFSPEGDHYLDTWSRVDHPPVYELRRTIDGSLVTELSRADASALKDHSRRLPERFVCKDRNGRFDIWGIIQYPPHFDPKKKYPVIESIYAGPHGSFVPKPFFAWRQHSSELLEEGFIVVNIDGLGTNFRHRDFWHHSHKNLVDSGFPDRIKWIKQAAKSRPFMDLSRVGIFGGSAGGQSSTAALLHHGDFYKAAVSDCGCHDNRMDKIWWNEQWMGWPVGPHYEEQSNVTNAHKLSGALMLTVGEIDRNVDPASTTQVANALIKAGKDFDYYVLPSAGHGAGENPYLRRKRAEFFIRHLGKAKSSE